MVKLSYLVQPIVCSSFCSRLWYGQHSLTSLLCVPEVAGNDKNTCMDVSGKTVSTKSNNNQQQGFAVVIHKEVGKSRGFQHA
jgi:hypothetical protein